MKNNIEFITINGKLLTFTNNDMVLMLWLICVKVGRSEESEGWNKQKIKCVVRFGVWIKLV